MGSSCNEQFAEGDGQPAKCEKSIDEGVAAQSPLGAPKSEAHTREEATMGVHRNVAEMTSAELVAELDEILELLIALPMPVEPAH